MPERERIKQQLRDLRAGWEWAFANGANCCGTYDPRLQRVLDAERALFERLAELDGEDRA